MLVYKGQNVGLFWPKPWPLNVRFSSAKRLVRKRYHRRTLQFKRQYAQICLKNKQQSVVILCILCLSLIFGSSLVDVVFECNCILTQSEPFQFVRWQRNHPAFTKGEKALCPLSVSLFIFGHFFSWCFVVIFVTLAFLTKSAPSTFSLRRFTSPLAWCCCNVLGRLLHQAIHHRKPLAWSWDCLDEQPFSKQEEIQMGDRLKACRGHFTNIPSLCPKIKKKPVSSNFGTDDMSSNLGTDDNEPEMGFSCQKLVWDFYGINRRWNFLFVARIWFFSGAFDELPEKGLVMWPPIIGKKMAKWPEAQVFQLFP